MQELIDRIVEKTGLAPEKAEKAAGIMLSLVKSQGDKNKVQQLFDAIPGAADLADRHGADGGKAGSLFNMLGGGMMGGPLVAVTKLQSAGLNMDQIKTAGQGNPGLRRRESRQGPGPRCGQFHPRHFELPLAPLCDQSRFADPGGLRYHVLQCNM
jgi:hypothetical protein